MLETTYRARVSSLGRCMDYIETGLYVSVRSGMAALSESGPIIPVHLQESITYPPGIWTVIIQVGAYEMPLWSLRKPTDDDMAITFNVKEMSLGKLALHLKRTSNYVICWQWGMTNASSSLKPTNVQGSIVMNMRIL
jgi:hypothetical protein